MKQEDYRSCMSKNMGGGRLKGLSTEDRKIEFCTIAKQCSKNIPYDEARRICLQPKPSKEPKAPTVSGNSKGSQPTKERKPRKSSSRGIDPAKLATCVASSLEMDSLTVNNVAARLETAIAHCNTGGKGSPSAYNRFMKSCLKENGGTLKTYQRDMKGCQEQWAKTQGA